MCRRHEGSYRCDHTFEEGRPKRWEGGIPTLDFFGGILPSLCFSVGSMFFGRITVFQWDGTTIRISVLLQFRWDELREIRAFFRAIGQGEEKL